MTLPAISSLTGAQTPAQKTAEEKKAGVNAQAQQQAQAQTMATVQPQQQTQTFAQMQAAGQARPAPPPAAPPPTAAPAPAGTAYNIYQGGTTPDISSGIRQGVLNMLQNPSYYNDELFQQKLQRGGEDIQDQYTLNTNALKEEMARRGLSDSSIYGGRMQDLNVATRTATTDLWQRLAEEQAKAMDEGRARAIGMGMDFEKMGYEGARLGLDQQRLQMETQLQREQMALTREVEAGRMTMEQARLELDNRRAQMEDSFNRAQLAQQGSQFTERLGLDKEQMAADKAWREQNFTEQLRQSGLDEAYRAARMTMDKEEADRMFQLRLAELYGTDTVDYADQPSVGSTPPPTDTGGTANDNGGVPPYTEYEGPTYNYEPGNAYSPGYGGYGVDPEALYQAYPRRGY